uniref:Uncharacterized protein n=1 Tax=Arundo donax TaxID=35708 RepID=A0A0A9E6R5_ARUDO
MNPKQETRGHQQALRSATVLKASTACGHCHFAAPFLQCSGGMAAAESLPCPRPPAMRPSPGHQCARERMPSSTAPTEYDHRQLKADRGEESWHREPGACSIQARSRGK